MAAKTSDTLKALFLGTGTSSGVPAIACDCEVCSSDDPRNKRRRTSLHLQTPQRSVLVDCAPDFREQALQFGVKRVDAVLFTHAHADHIFGFDDIRRYNTLQDQVIPAYGHPDTLKEVRRIFAYIGTEKLPGLFRPRIEFIEVVEPFRVGDLSVTPIEVAHGNVRTVGFRFDWRGRSFGYVPDCRGMDEKTVARFKHVDVMVLDCLRKKPPHATHLTLAGSLELLDKIRAAQSFLIHMCHDFEHTRFSESLPGGISPAYDGMRLCLKAGRPESVHFRGNRHG